MSGGVNKLGSVKYAKEVLSTDVKPVGAFSGQTLIEIDTGREFEWSGEAWYQRSIDSDNPLIIAASDTLLVAQTDLTHETDVVIVLSEISRKMSVLIEYWALFQKVDLEE
mgnify:CR=1 FL=1